MKVLSSCEAKAMDDILFDTPSVVEYELGRVRPGVRLLSFKSLMKYVRGNLNLWVL